MISLKVGVRILGLRAELLLGILVVNSVYEEFNIDLEITCLIEGVHSVASLHYAGQGVDLGVHRIPADKRVEVLNKAKNALGEDFDLLHEYVGLPNEHFHLEYQPKRSY
jgi:hypothetical protein